MNSRRMQRISRTCTAALLVCAIGVAGAGEKKIETIPGNVTLRVGVDRRVLPAGKKTKAVIKVALTAQKPSVEAKRTPVNLAIVLDKSGSMAGKKLNHAKAAAVEMLKHLEPDDLFSLVVYESRVKTLVSAQSAANADRIVKTINAIQAEGNAALFGGLSQGAAELRKNLNGRYFHRIILLSDGLANVGPSTPADLERLGRALVKENISVTSIGVGNDYNEDLMTRLSQASDGNAYYVENSRDLPKIFKKELVDVMSVAAGAVTVQITCPKGVKPVRIIGREGSIKQDRVDIYLNQLYGGQEKYVLIETEVSPHRDKENLRLGNVSVTYKDLVQQRKAAAFGFASVRFSSDEQIVLKSIDKQVQFEAAMNDSIVLVDRSVEQIDKGENAKAISALLLFAKNLRDSGATSSNTALLTQANELESNAAELLKNGLNKNLRKQLRTSNYQRRNQQKQQQELMQLQQIPRAKPTEVETK